MRGLLSVGVTLAAVGSVAVLGVAAQQPNRGAQPPAGRGAPPPLTTITQAAHVDHEKVGGGDCGIGGVLQSDRGPLNTATYFVECVHRQASALPYAQETHAAGEDEVFYVIKGEATIITGGRVVGKEIEGGTPTHLAVGDVMVVPGGLPHWFKEVPTQISYLLVRRKS